jgi:glycosyltransferase involved in cell wall biosynthesis
VITPYYREGVDFLEQCHQSVLEQQGVAADHIMVADGLPNKEVESWNARHVKLPTCHEDNGNTPRSVGGLIAEAEDYDFVAYLDADNWFHPNHLISLLQIFEQTSAPVCCSWRTFHRLDGSILPIGVEPSEENFFHVDTSCFLLHRSAFRAITIWHRIPRPLSPVCDRVFRLYLKRQGFLFGYSKSRTVAFRSQYKWHYVMAGETPPPGAKPLTLLRDPLNYLKSHAGVVESVDRLGFWPLVDPNFFR